MHCVVPVAAADEALLLHQITDRDHARLAEGAKDVRSFNYSAGALPARTISQGDGQGGKTGLWVDDYLTDDFFSAVARSARVVRTMERLS